MKNKNPNQVIHVRYFHSKVEIFNPYPGVTVEETIVTYLPNGKYKTLKRFKVYEQTKML